MEVPIHRGTPKSSICRWIFHYKPSILGYPHLLKPPYHHLPLQPVIDFYGIPLWDVIDVHVDHLRPLPEEPSFAQVMTSSAAAPLGDFKRLSLMDVIVGFDSPHEKK